MMNVRIYTHFFTVFPADNEKEQDMQIGYPTDVKHVAHIGWDGPSVNSPSWVRDCIIFIFIFTFFCQIYLCLDFLNLVLVI